MSSALQPPIIEVCQGERQKLAPGKGASFASAIALTSVFQDFLGLDKKDNTLVRVEAHDDDTIVLRSFQIIGQEKLKPLSALVLQRNEEHWISPVCQFQEIAAKVDTCCHYLIKEIREASIEKSDEIGVLPCAKAFVANHQELLQRLKQMILEREFTIGRLETELASADKAITALREVLSQTKESASQAQNQVSAAQELANSAKQQALVLQSQVNEFQARVNEAEESATQSKDKLVLQETLNKQLLQTKIPELQKQIESLQSALAQKLKTISQLENQARETAKKNQTEIEQTQGKLQAAEETNASLQKELEESRKRESILAKQNDSLKSENSELTAEIEKLQKRIAELEGLLKTNTENTAALAQELKFLKEQQARLVLAQELVQKKAKLFDNLVLQIAPSPASSTSSRESSSPRRSPSPPDSVIILAAPALPPLDPLVAAIAEGRLSSLFEEPGADLLAKTEQALNHLLQADEENEEAAKAVYNLALFLANHAPEKLKGPSEEALGTETYESLRRWIIKRGGSVGKKEAYRQQVLAAALAEKRSCALADLTMPCRFLQIKHKIERKEDIELTPKEQLLAALLGQEEDIDLLVENVREFLNETPEPQTNLDYLLYQLIHLKLGDLDLEALPSLEEESLGKPITAIAQLQKQPALTFRIGRLAQVKAQPLTADEWRRIRNSREEAIRKALSEDIADQDFETIIQNTRYYKEKRINKEPVETDPKVAYFARPGIHFNSDTLIDNGDLSNTAKVDLAYLENRIATKLEELTGLKAEKETAAQFCTSLAEGRTPRILERLINQGDGSEALNLVEMAYYFAALSHINPQKPLFAGIAKHTDWQWLTGTEDPARAANILGKVIRQFHLDEQLKGSALLPQQVIWAKNIFSILSGGKGEPIYSAAGSGKTLTARFAIRLAQELLGKDRSLHVLSPFAQKEAGLLCHQYIPGMEELVIEGNPQDSALLDEAHAWSPNGEVILRKDNSPPVSVEPLHMTATPVKRNRLGALQPKILPDLRKRQAAAAANVRTLDSEISDAAAQALVDYQADLTGKIKSSIDKKGYVDIPLKKLKGHPLESVIQGKRLSSLTKAQAFDQVHQFGDKNKIQIQVWKQAGSDTVTFILPSIRELCAACLPQARCHLASRSFNQIQKSDEVSSDSMEQLLFAMSFLLMPDQIPREMNSHPLERKDKIGICAYNNQRLDIAKPVNGFLQHISNKGAYQSLTAHIKGFAENLVLLRTAKRLENLPPEVAGRLPVKTLQQIQERSLYLQELEELHGKIESMQQKASRPISSVEQETNLYVERLQDTQDALFAKIDYQKADVIDFSPARTALEVSRALQEQELHGKIQLLFPGVRFNAANLPELLTELKQINAFKNRPVYFVYHDSHSQQDSAAYGKKLFCEDGQGALHPIEELEGIEENALVVMLYDTTNKQGGDFDLWSNASPDADILQYHFFNIRSPGFDPAKTTSRHDLYQEIRRCRGQSANSPCIFAPQESAEDFLEDASNRQVDLERQWAARDAAFRMSNKLRKLYLMMERPQDFAEQRRQRKEALIKAQDDDMLAPPKDPLAAHRLVVQALPGMANVSLVAELQKRILAMQEVKNPEDALADLLQKSEKKADAVSRLIQGALIPKEALEKRKEDNISQNLVWRIEKARKEIGLLAQRAANFRPADVIVIE